MAHDLAVCVCISQSVYLIEALILGYSGFCFSPWVIFLKPLCEIILFRPFSAGSRKGQHKSLFPEKALPRLSLPKATVEDMANALPQTVAFLVSSERRSQVF